VQGPTRARAGAALIILVGTASFALPPQEVSTAELQGAWQQVDGPGVVRVQDGQLVTIERGKLHIRGIVHYRQGSLVLRNSGELETWQAALETANHFRLGHNGEVHDYRRLEHAPAAPGLEPLVLGPSSPLPPERVQAIQREILNRTEREQTMRRQRQAGVQGILPDNANYLLSLVQEVGWIDATRFGQKVSVLATIMVKHTDNLALMAAVLPFVEKDLKDTGDGQTYAVLYDAVQLDLGRKQRYGTQIGADAKGEPYILPLEDPAKVDGYLKAIGLGPLSQYMADASKALFNGHSIRLARSDESD
jgi:hypothetical protein